jgi:hypothetical protein
MIIEPVAPYLFRVGVEITETAIGDFQFPGVAGNLLPRAEIFRASDNDLFIWRCLIGNTAIIGCSTQRWCNPFAVNSSVDGDSIAGLR